MHITLGNYELNLTRRSHYDQPKHLSAPTLLLSSAQPGPIITMNAEDNPRLLMSFIRETVAACMHARSEAVSRGRFRVRPANAIASTAHAANIPVRLNERAKAIASLLEQPNPSLDMCDLLELSQQWLDATGNALWLKVRNGHGNVVELWPVPALSFYIEKSADGMPAVYKFPQSNTSIAADDIIHIRRADIRTAPFLGHAVLSDILQTAKADTAVRLYQARFFENDAMPRAVMRWPTGSMLTQEQMDEVRMAWDAKYGTPMNAGKIGIIPDGGEIQLLGSGGRELDFGRTKKELRDTIREAFKVPQIVLGDVEGVNLSNAETSYTVFLRDVVDFSLAKHARALTRGLSDELGGEYLIEHESVMPENEDRFIARLKELKGVLTANEQRALLGFGPM